MLAFSWTKTTLSTEDGTKELLFALMVNPAIEKTRSDGALVAGIAKTIRASLPSTVNLVCLNIYNTVQLKIETSIYCVGGAPTRKSAAAAAAAARPAQSTIAVAHSLTVAVQMSKMFLPKS